MSDTNITREEPPPRIGSRSNPHYGELIDAAYETPGEWVSQEALSDVHSNTYTKVLRQIGARLAEVRIHDGRVYLRLKR